jgi:agmatine deiminase
MPAEWEPHQAVWLSWPHKKESWPGLFERIPPVWAAIVRALRESEEVRLLSRDPDMDDEIRRALDDDLHGVRLFHLPTNDAWIRDYGPIFVEREAGESRPAVLSWGFNSWGGKYGPWDLDDAVPEKVGEILGLEVIKPGMILEGGSIDADGEGTLLTTESCLLNQNRNPELDRAEIEARLKRFLGVAKILWLGDGISGDDTDGHVDDLTRFVAPGKVVTVVEEDPRDPNYRPLQENRERLRGMKDAAGRRLEVIELPMPTPVYHDGQRCPASYANFLLGNDVALVPTYRSERDPRVLGILSELLGRRKVVGIDCHDMVWGLGAIHCVTQQEPRQARREELPGERSAPR